MGAPVWQNFQLESSNPVYLIECKECNKLYVGETKNKLLKCLKQHMYYKERVDEITESYVHFHTHGKNNISIYRWPRVGGGVVQGPKIGSREKVNNK